jgi:CheY-like chemotaxis protein
MGRRSLPAGEGLLLRAAPAIHTAFMRFPIDALFLDGDLHVVSVHERLLPWRIASQHRARAVLELAAGECARRCIEVGDQLAVLDPQPVLPSRPGGGDAAQGEMTSTPDRRNGDVAQREPMRVLVIAHDRRFRSVASLLLAQRGCKVTTSSNASRVADLVARDGADVIVIDAGPLLTTARTVAAAQALRPPVGVVVVADEPESGLGDLPVLAKWGPFENIFGAIELADLDRRSWSRIGE